MMYGVVSRSGARRSLPLRGRLRARAMARRNQWLVIGISGVTCGGKTTLANKLTRAARGAAVLHQDEYFLPDDSPRHVRVPNMQHNNYDILSALDMKHMYRDALAIIEGTGQGHRASLEPASDERGGAEGGGGGGWLVLPGRRLLLLEGFTALNYRPIYDLCDLRYYMVLEYGECVSRRALRLYEPPDVAGYFELCVWPEHLRYKAELENDPKITILDGTRPDVFETVVRDLRRAGAVTLGDEQEGASGRADGRSKGRHSSTDQRAA